MCWTYGPSEGFPFTDERLVADLKHVTGRSDRALDEHVVVVAVVAGLLEDDDVAAVDVAVGQELREAGQAADRRRTC